MAKGLHELGRRELLAIARKNNIHGADSLTTSSLINRIREVRGHRKERG